MTKTCKNDWRPVATTDMLLTTTDVSLATTGALLTTTGDHWRPSAAFWLKVKVGAANYDKCYKHHKWG